MVIKKSKNPLVSVIINCCNGERYLAKCLESVINQSYKNWEIIFWDNCSKDNSEKIVKKIKDKRIKYFKSKKYYPLYEARNLAIKKSKGRFISFLDTDDWWSLKKIELQVRYLVEKKIDVVYSNFFLFYQNNKKKMVGEKEKFKIGFITQKLLDRYRGIILTGMLSKNIFKNKKFNKNYEIIGDFDFFVKLSINYKFGYIHKSLAFYRLHNFNLSKKRLDLHIQELNSWIKENNKNFNKMGFNIKPQKLLLFKLKLKNFLGFFKKTTGM